MFNTTNITSEIKNLKISSTLLEGLLWRVIFGVAFGRPFNFYNKLMQNVTIYAVGYLCTIYGTLDTHPLLAGLLWRAIFDFPILLVQLL
jgi:hypothetical protein